MENIRTPFQGITNIIRFNWHFYILSGILIIVSIIVGLIYDLREFKWLYWSLLILGINANLVSLIASYYIYDRSNLYSLKWLKSMSQYDIRSNELVLNIHAGFDETSEILKNIFTNSKLVVMDFYDPTKHTEVSIERARRAYKPYPNTLSISTDRISLPNESVDKIFLIFAAHEIRQHPERILFFEELRRILKLQGQIIILEHLRDSYNFFVYNIGFFHFHSKNTWLRTFRESGFQLKQETKITKFLSCFILSK